MIAYLKDHPQIKQLLLEDEFPLIHINTLDGFTLVSNCRLLFSNFSTSPNLSVNSVVYIFFNPLDGESKTRPGLNAKLFGHKYKSGAINRKYVSGQFYNYMKGKDWNNIYWPSL